MLLDTSGLFSLLHVPETHHELAHRLYENAVGRFTHGYALAELVALANTRRISRTGVLAFCESAIDNPDIDVIWIDAALHRDGMKLLQARPDKSYSLCDAVSFVLMRERKISDALTTDRHFEQEGFRRLLIS